jgi:tetratricopeptide (TPR) repeat protein
MEFEESWMKKIPILLFGVASVLILLLSLDARAAEEKIPEVISLLGKKLYATPAEGEELAKLESELQEALKAVEADPENVDVLIQYGRALAGLWRYHEAVDAYTRGIKAHPEVAMLFRHRGHRYISIRDFDRAATDLARAAELNDRDFDIWYHLGLAHYLKGDFAEASRAYGNCLQTAADDDSKVAVSNWLYAALRRLEKNDQAAAVLEGISEGMKVEENTSYYNLLLFFKGLKSEEDILSVAQASDLDSATVSYGVGAWHLYNGREEKARSFFEKIVSLRYWPAFGYIAAEAELARTKKY